ncbi:creatininase family protein [Proteiniphilum sp.]|uniref:creatininase family protein n=1 Tax=Proteiniphilum sp. TaxID=1926877 RepID=UPI002B21A028|nr:creatininase family protein [Proteiniphilum sp.]MEA4917166.1 creatininase family protein [Proteiniphilum sp.]
MIRPYILAESNWKSIKETDYDLAVLPWGATEAHNYHLPYATDNILAENIAGESARIAWEQGAKVIVLPTIPFGVNTGQLDIRLDMNIYPSTQLIILNDIVENLNRHGIRKMVILNSHGGNDFKAMVRELGAKYPDMFICVCNWFRWEGRNGFFEYAGDHADEMETSMLLHLTPQWVLPLDEAGDGREKKYKIKALREGWFWAERQWSKVSPDTGIGNPVMSTKEKGKQFFEMVIEQVGTTLVELARIDTGDMYE